jgi:hypothetical protein
MFAKNIEILLYELCEKADISRGAFVDIPDRFNTLRSYGRLPRGREKRGQHLTSLEIAAAILGLVPVNPNWAGHAATVLSTLRPVKGAEPSIFDDWTLQETIAQIVENAEVRKCVARLNISGAETATNSNGYATLFYEITGVGRRVHYGIPPSHQISSEQGSRPEEIYSPVTREVAFNRKFFDRMALEIDRAKSWPVTPAGDGSEYDAEENQQLRYKKLGVRARSKFLNIGVDNQVTWPKEETLIKFDRYHLVLMPKTHDKIQSIHVDLITNGLTDAEAITVINRFLSIMTWCDDQFAVLQDGWSGNPVPVAVAKRDLAFTTTYHWIFDRKIPAREEARRALAIYREARNAEQNYMISYAVLNYYKIIELKYHGRGPVKNWFRDNFEALSRDPQYRDDMNRFLKICGSQKPNDYIYESCRIAVAHSGKYSKSDSDDANELVRLHTAADIMRILARHFITTELKISDIMYSGD